MPYKDKEKERKHNKEYYQKHKSRLYKKSREWVKSPKGRLYAKNYRLKMRYGITLEEYDRLFELQHGVCAICGEIQIGKRLAVDHDHKTGQIRGLLCYRCNIFAGLIEERGRLYPKIRRYIKHGKT